MEPIDRLQRQLVAALQHSLAAGRPVVPEAGHLLWRWFRDLSATRTFHMAGPNPIPFVEIEAWARLNRWPLQPRHVAILRAMDEAYLEHAYKQQRRAAAAKPDEPVRVKQAMTPAAFSAMFSK